MKDSSQKVMQGLHDRAVMVSSQILSDFEILAFKK